MKTRLCQIRRIQYKTHILNKIQNNPNFSLSSSIALKNLFTLNAILPLLARLHQSLQEKEEEERGGSGRKHKRAKLLPPGRGKFPRGSLRSLRSLNCAYLCPFASGRPENYYVTCLRRGRGAKRIRRRRRRSYALVFYASSPFREPVLLCNDLEARENFFPIVDTNGYNNG